MVTARIDPFRTALTAFCQRWRVKELALFGSVVREDFREESDIDVLVEFLPVAAWSLLDHVSMQDELAAIFGRRVDLITRAGLDHSANSYRRAAILRGAQVIYAA